MKMILILSIIFPIVFAINQQQIYSCNASVSCGCSTNTAVLSRIEGGEEAGRSTWGWAVSLSINNNYLCGGSILSSLWIITAAHCVINVVASKVIVYAGSNSRWSGSQSRIVSHIVVHSYYNPANFVNDIALLRLGSPLSMTDSAISTICIQSVSSSILSTTEWPSANTTVVAIGWGRLNQTGPLPQYLQQVTLQTIDRYDPICRPLLRDWQVQLCAGVYGGEKSSCQGDSGGPLMMFIGTNQWVLIGLTSNSVGCDQAYAGIYTRIAAYQNWITTTTNALYSHAVIPSISSFVLLSILLFIFS